MSTYKGISFPFRFNSKGGVATSTLTPEDYSRIEESIRQIIFTRKRERIMHNDIGTDATAMLFEPTDDLTELGILRYEIMKSLSEQETRIEINDVSVQEVEVDGEPKLYITISCTIVKFLRDEQFTIVI